jgi:hypothetical protein
MQENDCNGNGVADERAFLCLGPRTATPSMWASGGWFGLTNGNFVVSTEDGSVRSAIWKATVTWPSPTT